MKATFIDFEDSFSFNVVQELVSADFEVEVVNWKDFETLPEEGLLVLGPGPGHPDDYQQVFSLIKNWMDGSRPLFGVCLGHQILWRILDEEVVRSKHPTHGQKVQILLPKSWQDFLQLPENVFVQRYNSLAVLAQSSPRAPHLKNLIHDDEIIITRGDKILTYQFHPESIGTSFRHVWIKALHSII